MLPDMGAAVRIIERGRRLGERFLRESGATFRDARVGIGVSQGHIAKAADVSRTGLHGSRRGR